MVTEPADPQIDLWADTLEEELVEAEMDPAQAKAFARAFQLAMSRVMYQFATKADLIMVRDDLRREIGALREEMQHEIGGLRAEIQREIDQLRADIDRRFRVLYWILGVGFGGMFALMAAILVRL